MKTPSHLRKRAEAMVQEQSGELNQLSPEESQHLIHELHVHQIELEMQHEELQRTHQELQRTYQELQASRNRYADLYDAAPVGYVTVDQSGVMLDVNLTYSRMIGSEKLSLLNASLISLIVEPDQDHFYLHVRKMLTAKTPGSCDVRMRRTDGSQFWAQLDCTPVLDLEEQVMRIRITITNITTRKTLEHDIKTLNITLDEELSLRLRELDMANRDLRDFIYAVSHDLQTPLRGIGHLVHWLVEDYEEVFDQSGKEKMRLLLDRLAWLEQLIQGLLRYSKIGRIVGEEESIDLDTLVRDILSTMATPATIRLTKEQAFPTVRGDPLLLAQVFQHLLRNAIERLDTTAGEIRIGWTDEDTHWQFFISDTGPEIAPGHHEHIFQLFQTRVSLDDPKRAGIGLALVKKIVELHAGKVWVTSLPHQRCTFFFTLPKHGYGGSE